MTTFVAGQFSFLICYLPSLSYSFLIGVGGRALGGLPSPPLPSPWRFPRSTALVFHGHVLPFLGKKEAVA